MNKYKKENQEIVESLIEAGFVRAYDHADQLTYEDAGTYVQAHGEIGRPQYKVRAGKLRIHRSFYIGTFVGREYPCDGVIEDGHIVPADL